MNAIRFEAANGHLGPPKGMTDADCATIHVYRTNTPDGWPLCVSGWRPTPEELVKLNLGEPLFLGVCMRCEHGNPTMPPVWLRVGSDTFAPPNEERAGG